MPRKVLIVEDEGLIALDLQDRLERAGYCVTGIADSMDLAVREVKLCRPDIVMMDIRIKGKHDGIETAAYLVKHFDIPVIFVTAHTDAATVERAKLVGPFGYIVKPFTYIDLRAEIEILLGPRE